MADLESRVSNSVPDAISAVSFSIVAGSIVETCSGMCATEVMKSRATMCFANMILGPLYGRCRDYVSKIIGTEGFIRKASCEVVSGVAFWGVVYGANLSLNCDSHEKMASTWCSMMVLMQPLNICMGYYMDWVRKMYSPQKGEGI